MEMGFLKIEGSDSESLGRVELTDAQIGALTPNYSMDQPQIRSIERNGELSPLSDQR